MFVLALIGAASALQLLILLRGYLARMLATYAWFYTYIATSLLLGAILGFVSYVQPAQYTPMYWRFQFLSLAIGCGIVLEIFKHVLADYAGAEKFARIFCLITFGLIFVVALVYPYFKSSEPMTSYQITLERNVRLSQSFFFVVILTVIFYYVIPLGRNMRGMLYGYGLYLGTSLVALALRAYLGPGFNTVWRIAQPLSFDVSLVIWLVAFWKFAPNPRPTKPGALGTDYDAIAALTKERIDALRSYLGRSIGD
jgi:hypothetical protein